VLVELDLKDIKKSMDYILRKSKISTKKNLTNHSFYKVYITIPVEIVNNL